MMMMMIVFTKFYDMHPILVGKLSWTKMVHSGGSVTGFLWQLLDCWVVKRPPASHSALSNKNHLQTLSCPVSCRWPGHRSAAVSPLRQSDRCRGPCSCPRRVWAGPRQRGPLHHGVWRVAAQRRRDSGAYAAALTQPLGFWLLKSPNNKQFVSLQRHPSLERTQTDMKC